MMGMLRGWIYVLRSNGPKLSRHGVQLKERYTNFVMIVL